MLIGQKPGGHPVICSWVKGEWFFARIFSFRLFFINRIIRFLTPSSPCILLCCSSRAWRQRLQTRTMDAWCMNQKLLLGKINTSNPMVFCYQNCTDLLWEKNVLVIEKNFRNSRLKAMDFQTFWDHLNNSFKQWNVRTMFGNRMLFWLVPGGFLDILN